MNPKSLITHMMIGSNDVARSKAFYDPVLGALGFGLGTDAGNHVYYMHGDGPALGVGKPFNGEIATVGNGGTIGFPAQSNAAVDAFHAAGLAHGGTDEGAPGPRAFGSGSSYGAYLRDPDGNKICAYAR
jgi:catechol 2,3-dioxygenase-like lactoylglutathione lyase family enzyme